MTTLPNENQVAAVPVVAQEKKARKQRSDKGKKRGPRKKKVTQQTEG